MLKSIVMVTILSLNLSETEKAYIEYLDYGLVERGVVSAEMRESWGTSALKSNEFIVLQPASKKQVFLRFVESETAKNYQPMLQEGWNATEILVKDPDLLAKQLVNSPFKMIGKPKFLTEKRNVRAFQALGPNNELLYFTRIIDPSKSSFNLGQAESFVDNIFIMVLGGSNLDQLTDFYKSKLGNPVSGPFPYRIGVLSRAYGLADSSLHQLSLVSLQEQFLVELDQYPERAKSLDQYRDTLPPGVAMVSFVVADLDNIKVPFFSAPVVHPGTPYQGRRSATVTGLVGERLELIEGKVE